MTTWYERAAQQIDDEHQQGITDTKEYHRQMRDLNQEYEDEARQAAKDKYDEFY